MFISFDGIDGCGKTTQIAIVANILTQNGFKVKTTKDPGDNKISEQIRSILLNPENSELCDISEFLLFLAARRQNFETVIKPHLNKGFVVLTDRYIPSTFAYQVIGTQIQIKMNLNFIDISNLIYSSAGYIPDKMFIFDISVDNFKIRNSSKTLDRIENLDIKYMKRVIDAFSDYECFCINEIVGNVAHIDANQNIETVTNEIITNLKQIKIFKNLKVGENV